MARSKKTPAAQTAPPKVPASPTQPSIRAALTAAGDSPPAARAPPRITQATPFVRPTPAATDQQSRSPRADDAPTGTQPPARETVTAEPAAPNLFPPPIPQIMPVSSVDRFQHWQHRKVFGPYQPRDEADSDVECSVETQLKLASTVGINILLRPLALTATYSEHHRRRLMFGNDRCPLVDSVFKAPFFRLFTIAYSLARGIRGAASLFPTELEPHLRRAIVPRELLHDVTGVFVLEAPPDDGSPACLRFVRAPIDYGHRHFIPALYGTTDARAAVTRTSDWSMAKCWESARCQRIRFTNGTRTTPTDGDWDHLVVVDVPSAAIDKAGLTDELGAPSVNAMLDPSPPRLLIRKSEYF